MRVAKAISLSEEEPPRDEVVAGAQRAGGLIQRTDRAGCGRGRENKDIAIELGCTRRTVGTWRRSVCGRAGRGD